MAPDFFSAMALRSLARVLPKWTAWSVKAAKQAVLQESAYPWPDIKPKYLGSIVQNYRIRSRDGKEAAPTRAYQKWFEALLASKQESLIPALDASGLLYANEHYLKTDADLEKFLVEVPDFNSLIAISQALSKPVFELDRDDIKNSGSVAENQVVSARNFKKTYSEASKKIIKLIG